MAATISENYMSRSFTLGMQAVRELVYDINNATDEAEAAAILAATAPLTYQGLVLDSLNADPVGRLLWKGFARYTRLDSGNEYTFDTGGGTVHLNQSLGTIASYAPAGFTAPDFEGMIGVSSDRIEGVDVPAPNFQFTETHRFADGAVDSTYRRILFLMTGMANNATFKGLSAGECLFLGATGSKRGDEQWSITFRFSGAPNLTGQTVGTITGIDKRGWDHIWTRCAEFEDSSAYCLVQRPIAVYVEQVVQFGDFSDLGIGT